MPIITFKSHVSFFKILRSTSYSNEQTFALVLELSYIDSKLTILGVPKPYHSLVVILEVFGGQVLKGITVQVYFRVELMLTFPVLENIAYI